MWPSFTVRLLQDTAVVPRFLCLSRDSWAVIAQILSAVALVYAAWVASRYQKKKEKLARKQKVLSHLVILKLFNETVTAYFYVAKGGSDLPHYYNQSYILKQLWEELAKIQEMKDEIASNLPLMAVEPFHRFVNYARSVDKVSDLSDENMEDAWKSAEKQLQKVITIIEDDNKPFSLNQILHWRYLKKSDNTKSTEQKSQ